MPAPAMQAEASAVSPRAPRCVANADTGAKQSSVDCYRPDTARAGVREEAQPRQRASEAFQRRRVGQLTGGGLFTRPTEMLNVRAPAVPQLHGNAEVPVPKAACQSRRLDLRAVAPHFDLRGQ